MTGLEAVREARRLAQQSTAETVGPVLYAMLPFMDAMWIDAERALAEVEEIGGALATVINMTGGGRRSDAIGAARVFVSTVQS